MNVFIKLYFPFLLILFSCKKEIPETAMPECDLNIAPSTHPKAAMFDSLMKVYVAKGLPGVSMLISDSAGTYVGSAGFADLAAGVPFSPCHLSKAASITKMMMGVLTFQLEEEGFFQVDDPIENYLDREMLEKIDNAEGKTILQLMNHTTGIYDVITSSEFYLAVLNNPLKNWTQEELLKYVYGKEGYELGNPYPAYYSNTNTLLLSMIIEKATGQPHGKLLREKIWDPLGMQNTFYQGRETLPETSAQGYFDLHNNGRIVNVTHFITGSGNGYGGVFSNVFDLHLFLKALLIDKIILSDESLQRMQQFYQEDEDFYTGAGLIKKFTDKPEFAIGHTGRDLGYSANLFYFPQKGSSMVFFVNYGTNGESTLRPVFREFESRLTDLILK
jgi:D-alanyl-D-alanine carboxypeptidase